MTRWVAGNILFYALVLILTACRDDVPDHPIALATEIVKEFEGLRLEPYHDADGWVTVGYGHKMAQVARNAPLASFPPIDESTALMWLTDDLREAQREVRALVKVSLTDGQESALVSFTFNEGGGRLAGSTLLADLNRGEYDKVPDQLRRWDYAGGKVLVGLQRRREAEIALWEGRQ